MVLDEIPYPADLSYPLEAVIARLATRPRLFFVCNPNNPTGTLLNPSVIVRLARGAPDTLVVVDELYAPFTGQSVVPAALALDNVVALHSLSKTAGLAALRLGFAVGPPPVLDRLARVTGPYDINALAVVAGRAALADPDYMRDYVAQVLAAKTWTVEALRQRGVRHFAGGGNYLWQRFDRRPWRIPGRRRARQSPAGRRSARRVARPSVAAPAPGSATCSGESSRSASSWSRCKMAGAIPRPR
jgi:histidinol-phosphate aminotransferase